ncbi:MAG: aminoacyl-tRNA hydrolase [Lachnospiraceae bacterium]|nr:aminoacyl-tRNA hydrolase [Lachnospiraceae bacterium]
MKIIVGLGNPTAQYHGTRHNVGFSVISELSEQYNIDMSGRKHKAVFGKGIISGERVILAMPQTYMNLSGESVRELLDYYKVSPEDMIVVYDDINLAVGRLRIRKKGSAGGHNGMKNIIKHLGTEQFPRVRVGVGEKPRQMDLADYVLSRFDKTELEAIRQGCTDACHAISLILKSGIDEAMNQFN